ncbi:MAG TPA: hypothetical protein D7H88_04380 [Candidatus Poseidoniales archaeon]|nr:MAG TPA: hypothetical protein D7H88_04380 [Candidatus Poseidoniales archaeon]HII20440.1 hypothetical protein [Poseidonia sp.]
MVDFQEVLRSRRTVHRFTGQPVEQGIVDEALRAANQAPCHRHTHPWKFYILGQETRQTLVPTISHLSAAKSQQKNSTTPEEDIQRAIAKVMQPPVLVVVTSQLSPEDAFREKEDYAASVCALHNMVLSLWGNGVAAKWSTGGLTRHAETYANLGLNREEEQIIGFVKAGYADLIPTVKKPEVEATTKRLP